MSEFDRIVSSGSAEGPVNASSESHVNQTSSRRTRRRRRSRRTEQEEEEEDKDSAATGSGRTRRRRRQRAEDKMVSEADHDKNCNGTGGERRLSTKIEIRLNSDANSYKPLVNQNGNSESVTPCTTDQEELEMLNLEDARLLSMGDGETTETPTPELSVTTVEVEETAVTIAWQVAIPFLIAGLGMVGAGLVLDIVQHWEVFRVISEVFILVPALLGLKGNLEMTLASRLSTQANLGNMDTPSELWKMIGGNLALIQCQAAVVGFLASLFAVIMGWIPDGVFQVKHALLLCASSLVTASIASFVLGAIMVGVIVVSRKINVNPDNVATPIAASLGDLITLSLLAGVSSGLYISMSDHEWLAPTIICLALLLTPFWAMIAKRNPTTCKVLYNGWIPIIASMGISSLGGLILDYTVENFKGIAVFQPVINGVGGNLVAVHASRISTSLHQFASLGSLPIEMNKMCINPCTSYFGKDVHARTSRVLMLLVVPGHLIFTYTIFYVKAGHTSLTPVFVFVYLFAAVLQVGLLLYIARIMISWMWIRGVDPDNSAIPYLTALGDLLGTALLAIAFHFLYLIGDKDSDVGE